jgi:hypothetical protein
VGVKELERRLVLIPELVSKTCGGSTESPGLVTASQKNLEAMSVSTPSHISQIHSLQVHHCRLQLGSSTAVLISSGPVQNAGPSPFVGAGR